MPALFYVYPGYVWQDPLDDLSNWTETDASNFGNLSNNTYVKAGEDTVILDSDAIWRLTAGSEWDFYIKGTLDDLSHTAVSTYFFIRGTEKGPRGSSNGTVGIYYYEATEQLTWYIGADQNLTWGSPSTGPFGFRMKEEANGSVTFWVWDNNRWEYDGNPAGYNDGRDWLQGDVAMEIFWTDLGAGGYFDSTVTEIKLISGSRTII